MDDNVMMGQNLVDYGRIAEAIEFMKANFKSRPSLDELAEKVHVSPYHFQRMFTDWAGVSPKKFMQYLSVEYAKGLLKEKSATLFDVANETGLSGTGRLHDLFVKIEGMTPGEYKNEGAGLVINYDFSESPFGTLIVASTPKGICYMAFVLDGEQQAFDKLKSHFSQATFLKNTDEIQQEGLNVFQYDGKGNKLRQIKLHLKGTPFQLKVWGALLQIPMGGLATYGKIANKIESPNASRAVGTAIGSNPVAYLIPCHRVIQSSGNVGGYMWGSTRKSAIIAWEASKVNIEYFGSNSL